MTKATRSAGGYARPWVVAEAAIRLDLNEAPREAAAPFRARLVELLAGSAWRRYPDIDGRTARAHAAALHGWRPEGTLVGNGSNELLAAATRALLPRGGAVAALSPSFSMYPVLSRRRQAEQRLVPLRPPDFRPDKDEILAAAAAADLVLLCSPNNPTGGELDEGLWREVLALGKPTVWDAAYAEFSAADTVAWLGRCDNLLVLRSLSKAWGLAGLRVGALLAAPALVERVAAELLPFGAGWTVQAAYQAACERRVDGAALVRETIAERERQIAALRGIDGAVTVRSAANFFLLARPGWTGEELAAALASRGIAVRDIPELVAAGYVRVTVGARAEGDALIAAMREVCSG